MTDQDKRGYDALRAKLTRTEVVISDENDDPVVTALVNPDGPEAAEAISTLLRALVAIEGFSPVEGPMPPYVQIATFAKQTARAVLSTPMKD